jgi:hypothetical protein
MTGSLPDTFAFDPRRKELHLVWEIALRVFSEACQRPSKTGRGQCCNDTAAIL